MVHSRPPAILPSLLACDLAKLADEANRVCPNETDYVRAPPPARPVLSRALRPLGCTHSAPAALDRREHGREL
jgi:hypothetical protein